MLVQLKRQLRALYYLIEGLINRKIDAAFGSLEQINLALKRSEDITPLLKKAEANFKELGLTLELGEGSPEDLLAKVRGSEFKKVSDLKKLGQQISRQILIIEGQLEEATYFSRDVKPAFDELNALFKQSEFFNKLQRDFSDQRIEYLNQFLHRYRETQVVLLLDVDGTLLVEQGEKTVCNQALIQLYGELGWKRGCFLTNYEVESLYFTPERRETSGPTRLELLNHLQHPDQGMSIFAVVGTYDYVYAHRTGRTEKCGALYQQHYRPVDQLALEKKSAKHLEGELRELEAGLLEFAENQGIWSRRQFASDPVPAFKAIHYQWLRQLFPEPNRLFIFWDDKALFRDQVAAKHAELQCEKDALLIFDPLKSEFGDLKTLQEYREECLDVMNSKMNSEFQAKRYHTVIALLLREQGALLRSMHHAAAPTLLSAVQLMAKQNPQELVDLLCCLEVHRLWDLPELHEIGSRVLQDACQYLQNEDQRYELIMPVASTILKSIRALYHPLSNPGSMKKSRSFALLGGKNDMSVQNRFGDLMKAFYKSVEDFIVGGQYEWQLDKCRNQLLAIEHLVSLFLKNLEQYAQGKPQYQHAAFPQIRAATIALCDVLKLITTEPQSLKRRSISVDTLNFYKERK